MPGMWSCGRASQPALQPANPIARRSQCIHGRFSGQRRQEQVHVTDLKSFFGSRDDGLRAARIDYDQYETSRIIAYRGCPLRRPTISLLVLFTDGDKIWKLFDSEMSNNIHFERFVAAHPDLKPLPDRGCTGIRNTTLFPLSLFFLVKIYMGLLLHPAADFDKHRTAHIALNPVDPANYASGRHIYVDIRAWIGPDCPNWYPNTGLPDLHRLTYRVLATFNGNSNKLILNYTYPYLAKLY